LVEVVPFPVGVVIAGELDYSVSTLTEKRPQLLVLNHLSSSEMRFSIDENECGCGSVAN